MAKDLSELPTNEFDWGLDNRGLVDKLSEVYPYVEEVVEANLGDLIKISGIGHSTAAKIMRFGSTLKTEVKKLSKNGKENNENLTVEKELLDHKPSRRELKEIKDKLENTPIEEEDEYVLVYKQVDKFYTKASRIKVGPAVCRECGFDVITVNELPPWEELEGIDRSKVKQTLAEHMRKYHSSPSGKRILTATEMKATNWLYPETTR